MTFKENLESKIKLNRLLRNIVSTIEENPGKRRLDKDLTRELLDMTDLEHKKVRDLDLYVRALEGEIKEVVVLDNELPIYHTTVDDVVLRRSPYWQEMISIKNIMKIMNDKDVIMSKGKESLKKIHADALALLDLRYTRDDLTLLLEDARQAFEEKSITQIQESFDLFFELLDFQAVSLEKATSKLRIFARPKPNGSAVATFEHPIVFDEENLSLGLKKGTFSPHNASDLEWLMAYAGRKKSADLQGTEVFEFLVDLALQRAERSRL